MKRIICVLALMLCVAAMGFSQTQTGEVRYVAEQDNWTQRPHYKWSSEVYEMNGGFRVWGVACKHGSGYRLKINDGAWMNCDAVSFDGRIPKEVRVRRSGRKGRTIQVITKAYSPKYAHAQQKSKPAEEPAQPAKTETVRLDVPAQQELAELQRQAAEYRVASEAAAARYDAAQQKVVTAIFKGMAETGCSPKVCQIKQSQQEGIYFERTKSVETAAASVPGKPASPAKP